ncbi:NACHT nucleoside triphosphatase [Penicillium brevicompactum]|uniref:NACHT nucleoside triphosphatase n=1 Tax=Penicillium brevicompactum TaxID=5074 RepID=UPI00253F9126|nr:NACHT nucleoside triphosphatase [Penicillium brevicompactum]KAJ5319627.1 NACHT nucleoside triphosphatase [Penicillium brevicompactum]
MKNTSLSRSLKIIITLIRDYNVIITCLSNIGTNPTATVATSIINTFQSIRFGLMVGISGEIPSKINLGNIVDIGKLERDRRFVRTDLLNQPPNALLNTLN